MIIWSSPVEYQVLITTALTHSPKTEKPLPCLQESASIIVGFNATKFVFCEMLFITSKIELFEYASCVSLLANPLNDKMYLANFLFLTSLVNTFSTLMSHYTASALCFEFSAAL